MSENKQRLFAEFTPPTYDEWKVAAEQLLKGRPFDKVMRTKTPEGITLEPIYLKEDLFKLKHIDSLPGFPPYVRGTKVITDKDVPWLVAQQIYEPTPEQFNEVLLHDIDRGQTALSFKIDANTQNAVDPDDAKAEKTGYRGVSLASLADVKAALKGIVLKALPYHLNVGQDPLSLSALLFAQAQKHQGLDKINGVIGCDPLGYTAFHGKMDYKLADVYDHMADIIKYTEENKMNVRTILVEGHPYHNGGADSITEVAYVLTTLTEYIEAMLERGLDIDVVSKHIAVSLSIGGHYFMEIAKMRAVKMLYANVIKAYGGSDEAQKIYLHAKTSSWNMTVYDPYVNMLRAASEAFSATVGVVDSLSVVPFDETIRAADDFSRRIARNLQYLLIDEIHVNQPLDPAGGSWYVENLTAQIAEKTWARFQELSTKGKMSEILASGEPRETISAKYEERFARVANRKKVYVGINQYANMTEVLLEHEDTDYDAIAKERAEVVKKYKADRGPSAADTLAEYTKEPTIKNAVRAAQQGATIGELGAVLRVEDGFKATEINTIRAAKRIEDLRDESTRLKAEGKEVKIFSTNMGKLAVFKPRADFSRGFFEVGGFNVIPSDGFDDPHEAAKAAIESGAHVAIICSSDKVYPDVVETIASDIKAANSKMKVMVAGKPPEDMKPKYDAAGVDGYIFMGCDNYHLLKEIQEEVSNA